MRNLLLLLLLTTVCGATTKIRLHSTGAAIPGYKAMDLSFGPSGRSPVTSVTAAVSGGTDIQLTDAAGGNGLAWISEPFSAGFTLSGTVSCNLYGGESSAAGNAAYRCRLFKYSGGSEGAAFSTCEMTSGLDTSTTTARNWSCTPASTNFAPGDRLVARFFLENCAGSSCPAGNMSSSTVSTHYEGPSDGADGSSWVQLSETQGFAPEGGAGGTPSLVQWAAGTFNDPTHTITNGGIYTIPFPNATLAGNCVVAVLMSQTGTGTIVASDDRNNVYNPGPMSSLDGMQLISFYATNVAAGASKISFMQPNGVALTVGAVYEYANCATASTLDASRASATASNTALNAGSLSPAEFSGDLLHESCLSTNGTPGTYTPGSQAGIAWLLDTANNTEGVAAQWGVYNSTAPLSPTMTQDRSLNSVCVALALKASATGTPRPAGMRIIGYQHFDTSDVNGSRNFSVQFPTYGNLEVVNWAGAATKNVSGISDNHGNAWNAAISRSIDGADISIWRAKNTTPSNNLKLNLSLTASSGQETGHFIDIVGAAVNPDDPGSGSSAAAGGNASDHNDVIQPAVKPSGPGIIIFGLANANNTVGTVLGSCMVFDTLFWTGNLPVDNPADRNNGFAHCMNPGSAAVTPDWSFLVTTANIGDWATDGASFLAAAGGVAGGGGGGGTVDTAGPTAPGGLSAGTASASQINLSWSASVDNVGVTQYVVERCSGAGCSNFAQAGTTAATTYSSGGLTSGTSYSFRVRASDAANNLGPYSNIASATTAVSNQPADTQIPSTPGTLTANAAGSTQINVSWTASTDNVGISRYLIERCQGAGCTAFAQVGTATDTTFSNAGLAVGTSYTYRVRATDAAGNASGYSNTASATTPQGTANPGLVAAYSFDEGAGTTLNDLSGNGNTGTIANAAWTTGKYGNALSFNGTNARVNINDSASLHLTSAMTLEAWVNPTTVSSAWRDVIYKGGTDNYLLEGTTDRRGMPGGGGTFNSADIIVFGTTALVTKSWAHLAVTYDGANLRFYQNGALVSTSAKTGNILVSNSALQIGGDSVWGQYFSGGIDEVRVYNTALSQAQIQADMATPVASGGSAGGSTGNTPPTAPGTLTAGASSGSQINLNWTASTDDVGVSQYLVESCSGAGCSNFLQIGTATATTFSNTGLAAGTNYSYRVRATDASNSAGPYSNIATAMTPVSSPSADTQAPSTPGTLTANAAGSTQINLGWAASTDNVAVSQYLIERCQGAGCASFAQIGTATATTFSNAGLAVGTNYTYRVRATDAAGNASGYSNTASATTAQGTANPGLVAAYSFDEGTGTTVNDLSGNGNTGTIANATWTTGKYGNALNFNGANARVNINDSASLHLTSAMTLEAWVSPTTVSSAWRDVIYKGGNDNYLLEGTTDHRGVPGGGGTFNSADLIVFGTTGLTTNSWTHLALTYDGSTIRFYVNGAQVSSLARTGNILVSNTALQIGGDSTWGQYFAGLIDEVRIYNNALTQGQIQSDMATPVAGSASGSAAAGSTTPTPPAGTTQSTTTQAPTGAPAASGPSFTQQPANKTVTAGQTATFTASAGGTAPLAYQWQRGTTNIPGATSTSYTTPSTSATDNGSQFRVVVTNSSGSITSNPATLTVTAVASAADVLTYHNDMARTGANLTETTLTTANVGSTTFGKLATYPVDGKVDAQPLYASKVNIPGGGTHNLLIVATEHGSVYAFDADSGAALWQKSMVPAGESASDDRSCKQVTPEIGITSTPVIDRSRGANGAIYLIAMSMGGSGYHQRLHALDLASGAELFSGPKEITATYPGVGDNTDGTNVIFDPSQYEERMGLLLMNGVVYTAWASHCDNGAYNGWVMGFNADTLSQSSVLNVVPNGSMGAFWSAGGGIAADNSGNIYLLDGNGDFGTNLNASGFPSNGNFGNGFLKLSTSNGLAVADYFEMFNEQAENSADLDLGSGGAIVLPDFVNSSGQTVHIAVGAGKDTNIYVVNLDNMGKFNPNTNNVYEELDGALSGGMWSVPVYFNNKVYYGPVGNFLRAFTVTNGMLSTSSTAQSGNSFPYPGVSPAVSANGTGNGIVWAVENGTTGVLHAYEANSLNELYNSNQVAARDRFGATSKFSTPTIVNGKVFIGTANAVAVFGLLPQN